MAEARGFHMDYDVARVRAAFPALAEGAAHFDGPGGSQVPRPVADAVSRTLTAAISNQGTVTRSARRAAEVVVAARAAMADFVGGVERGIIFGRSMTQLTFDLSRAMAKTWEPGDRVVVTRLDHDANIRPWVYAAAAAGVELVWVDFDPATGELASEAVAAVIDERTRVVAVTAASNLLGTRPDVAAIAAAAHQVGALVYVDGVHYSPHALPDLEALGADVFACSPYKFLGPHCGVLAARPELLETWHPDKLLPQTDDVPGRFELGTLPYELMAGTSAAVDFLAGLDGSATGSRRDRLRSSYAGLEAHEDALRQRIESGLDDLGATVYSRAARRTPTLLFDLPGHDAEQVQHLLADKGVNAPTGSFYALEAARLLGLGDSGAVRVGIAPYNDDDDVDRLLDALAEIARLPADG
jgi:cysteine desulfurase family protein (TIGR01976 family)